MENLYEKGIEKAAPGYVLFENILILGNIFLGFWGMYSIKIFNVPVLSIIYAAIILYMLTFVLRKHLCTQCFYFGKTCHCGWGRLASGLYKQNSGNQEKGGKLAGATWATLMLVPIIAITIKLILSYSNNLLFLLIAFVVLVIINLGLHVKDCKECKMKNCCPGSAAKDKTA